MKVLRETQKEERETETERVRERWGGVLLLSRESLINTCVRACHK